MTEPERENERPEPRNVHATCLVLGDRGVLITGASGSGKSALALRLIRAAEGEGLFARLVADDQVFVTARSGRIICRTPKSIAGLVELRGAGIVPVRHENAAVAHLCVNLRPATEIERMPDGGKSWFSIGKTRLKAIDLPENSACENETVVFRLIFDDKCDANNIEARCD